MKRRQFLGVATFAPLVAAANNQPPVKWQPLVISTWDAGVRANAKAWEILAAKGNALDAVEKGVMVTELEQNCCVGLGAMPDREGIVTLDAAIMDHQGNTGSVAFLEQIQHPINVARTIMEKCEHNFLVGEGAQQFALEHGFKLQPKTLSADAKKAYEQWLQTKQYVPIINRENLLNQHPVTTPKTLPNGQLNHDTISMIALDAQQNLSASCTTSGQGFKRRGRIGDAPIIGSGLYVDNTVGACAATGQGEDIVRIVGSHTVVELMRQGLQPTAACKKAIERLVQLKGADYCKKIQVCFIAVNKAGQYGGYSLVKGFSYAIQNSTGSQLIDAPYLLS
ncbi:MAG: glycosylasparaginase [Bacteroidetes bacterium]|nr:MAG: glycosylasparaginase [Bacteroidota bacterium]TAE72183.1 MAG: glycosylasparaginase [Bacteroidota bacterium]TAF93098.1 MAG: glycosylasparaginase [Bacteroidota bacterium]